ncbi:MAG: serine protease, partial [Pseudomonadota bacterium]
MVFSKLVLRLVLVGAALILPGFSSAETVPTSRAEITGTFAPLVAETAPAVVSIQVKQAAQTRRRPSSLFDDPFFQR